MEEQVAEQIIEQKPKQKGKHLFQKGVSGNPSGRRGKPKPPPPPKELSPEEKRLLELRLKKAELELAKFQRADGQQVVAAPPPEDLGTDRCLELAERLLRDAQCEQASG